MSAVRRWMPHIRRKRSESNAGHNPPISHRTLELLVLEGPDAGSVYTVDGEEVSVGRGASEKGRTGAICLSDPTVSPRQATIQVTDFEVSITHREGATNPTRVNGQPIQRSPMQVGDRIQMGRTVFEVRSRPGISLSGLMTVPLVLTETTSDIELSPLVATTTEIRSALPPPAELKLVRGISGWEGKIFPITAYRSVVGRSPDSDIHIPERGVSRTHAELVWEEGELHLVHKSATNATYVDGAPVTDSVTLRGGESIQFADQVVLEIAVDAPSRGHAPTRAVPPEPASSPDSDASPADPPGTPGPVGEVETLQQRMEEKIRRDEEIEREFGFAGSFLDLDVVDSHGLKVQASRPEHIIVSFERFRGFAQQVVEEFEGQVLNSNGDELMCYFDEPLQSVRAAIAVLDRLADFNQRQNLLGRPFRVRQGIHTGRSLVDRKRGVAYSPVLDVAGHLQKYAPVDGLLVSAETLAELPAGIPFSEAGEVGKEKVVAFRLDPLDEAEAAEDSTSSAAEPAGDSS